MSGLHDTDDFPRSWAQRLRTAFSENAFSGGDTSINGSPSKKINEFSVKLDSNELWLPFHRSVLHLLIKSATFLTACMLCYVRQQHTQWRSQQLLIAGIHKDWPKLFMRGGFMFERWKLPNAVGLHKRNRGRAWGCLGKYLTFWHFDRNYAVYVPEQSKPKSFFVISSANLGWLW